MATLAPGRQRAAAALQGWNRLYAWGAIAAAASVIFYLAALGVFIIMPETPTRDGHTMLAYVHDHEAGYVVRQVLWAIPNGLLTVTFLALAVELRHVDHPLAAAAGLLTVASWAIAVGWATTGDGSFAMVTLAERYADATTDGERAALAGAAEALMALNDAPAANGVLQTIGILLFGVLLVRSGWSRWFAWLAVATGALGIVSEAFKPLLGGAYAVYGIVLFVWMAWLAVELWRRSSEATDDTD
jgi:hypothetical protein